MSKRTKNYLFVYACLGQKADQNKTLFEMGIKNGEQILFMNNNTTENIQEDKDKKELEYKFTEREYKFLKKRNQNIIKFILIKDWKNQKSKK